MIRQPGFVKATGCRVAHLFVVLCLVGALLIPLAGVFGLGVGQPLLILGFESLQLGLQSLILCRVFVEALHLFLVDRDDVVKARLDGGLLLRLLFSERLLAELTLESVVGLQPLLLPLLPALLVLGISLGLNALKLLGSFLIEGQALVVVVHLILEERLVELLLVLEGFRRWVVESSLELGGHSLPLPLIALLSVLADLAHGIGKRLGLLITHLVVFVAVFLVEGLELLIVGRLKCLFVCQIGFVGDVALLVALLLQCKLMVELVLEPRSGGFLRCRVG